MKQLRLILTLMLFSGSTNLSPSNAHDTFQEMNKNWELWRKHPELHPNVLKGTECRQAIANGTATSEQQAVVKYLDLCKNSKNELDNCHRALVAAQYNLTAEECHEYNNLLLQIHKGLIDNSFSEEVAVLVKVESIYNPDYDIIELAVVIMYFINNRDNKDIFIGYENIHKIRRDLEKLMRIKIIYF